MRYYIITGEASGDLHASNLIREIKKTDPDAEFRAWGGDLMQAAGAELVKHYRDLAFMGFTEVVANLRTILKNIEFCKQDILNFNPDAIILVDYPGFNLRIATFAHKKGYKVLYYISPQIWAWKQSRVHRIKRDVDHMFVILPFEEKFYDRFGYKVDFVGHPLLDAIKNNQAATSSARSFSKGDKPVVALLPGSRKQEIESMLPIMLSCISEFPDYDFVIAAAPSQPEELYRKLIGKHKVGIVFNQTYELLRNSHAALVTSGTATLETALMKVPEVVCYKGGRISYSIARMLVKVPFISLVNLIMEREVVKELIQDDMNPDMLRSELSKILVGGGRDAMLRNYEELRLKLGGSGASEKTAGLIHSYLNDKK